MNIRSSITIVWLCGMTTIFGHQQQQFGVPQQQQHAHGQQPPHGQVPVGTADPQAHVGGSGNVFDKSQVQDRDHIKEHLEGVIQQPDTSKMSEQELQFHYFKMHDNDNNNKLDGTELIKSLIHWHVNEGHHDPNSKVEPKIFTDEEFLTLIDPILESDDANRDGYIDYPEFVAAQAKMAARTATATP